MEPVIIYRGTPPPIPKMLSPFPFIGRCDHCKRIKAILYWHARRSFVCIRCVEPVLEAEYSRHYLEWMAEQGMPPYIVVDEIPCKEPSGMFVAEAR